LLTENRELNLHSRIIQQAATGMLTNQRERLNHTTSELIKASGRFQSDIALQLNMLSQRIPTASNHRIAAAIERIEQLKRQLTLASTHNLSNAGNTLSHLEKIVAITDPQNILRKGYSISYANGAAIRDVSQLKPGDQVTTILAGGSFESEVKTIHSN
jgi:exodeoxyribonuclease VII large subunit